LHTAHGTEYQHASAFENRQHELQPTKRFRESPTRVPTNQTFLRIANTSSNQPNVLENRQQSTKRFGASPHEFQPTKRHHFPIVHTVNAHFKQQHGNANHTNPIRAVQLAFVRTHQAL
jgi:hypothetical protein